MVRAARARSLRGVGDPHSWTSSHMVAWRWRVWPDPRVHVGRRRDRSRAPTTSDLAGAPAERATTPEWRERLRALARGGGDGALHVAVPGEPRTTGSETTGG